MRQMGQNLCTTADNYIPAVISAIFLLLGASVGFSVVNTLFRACPLQYPTLMKRVQFSHDRPPLCRIIYIYPVYLVTPRYIVLYFRICVLVYASSEMDLALPRHCQKFQKQRFDGPVMSYKISSFIAFSVTQGLLEKLEVSNKSSTDLSSFAAHPRL